MIVKWDALREQDPVPVEDIVAVPDAVAVLLSDMVPLDVGAVLVTVTRRLVRVLEVESVIEYVAVPNVSVAEADLDPVPVALAVIDTDWVSDSDELIDGVVVLFDIVCDLVAVIDPDVMAVARDLEIVFVRVSVADDVPVRELLIVAVGDADVDTVTSRVGEFVELAPETVRV